MFKGTFQHRSGRVIALGRMVLAAVFLFAIYLDPSQPNQSPSVAYGLLMGYVIWSAGLLILTWTNWWLDYRLAAFAHLVDIAAFGTLVFFTEGYTSPFYTFFVFLLLSSAIRWSWRETALTAAAVAILFFAAGTATLALGAAEIDLQRLIVRLTHLIVLSLLFIWFGVNQQESSPDDLAAELEPQPDADGPPIQLTMNYAAERTRAQRIVFAWWQKEEPWLHVAELEGDSYRSTRVGPEAYDPLFSHTAAGCPFLFDRKRRRGLCRSSRSPNRLHGFPQTIDPHFADQYRLETGLAIRVRCDDYEGELLALNIEGLCADDLGTAVTLGREISALFDRSAMLAVSEETAFNRARMSLARDLHDSVVQVLAGASFRLEALKSWIKAGRDPEPEIDAVKADLTGEQKNIRTFIASLRSGRTSMKQTDLAAGLPALCEQIQRRWNLDCDLTRPPGELVAPIWIEHELHQIIREAAANAARHGRATALNIALRDGDGDLELNITDNGVGFPGTGSGGSGDGGQAASPWSVHERVKGLGGTLSLFSGGGGSRLQIKVPIETHS
jgi:signal transduction histidine kinase